MADAERVYTDWVEARSFSCKRCGYTSTNRRLVEQHLRLTHRDLFEGVDLTPQLPVGSAGTPASPRMAQRGEGEGANLAVGAARRAAPTPPSDGGRSKAAKETPRTSASRGAARVGEEVMFYTDAGTWDNGTSRQRSVLAVWDSRAQGIVIHEELPDTTNNEAEYAAIIAALELARHDRLTGIRIRSDSQLCVRQINGQYQVKEERLRPLRDRAARLLKEVRGTIDWVPRGQNYAGIFLEKKYKR